MVMVRRCGGGGDGASGTRMVARMKKEREETDISIYDERYKGKDRKYEDRQIDIIGDIFVSILNQKLNLFAKF